MATEPDRSHFRSPVRLLAEGLEGMLLLVLAIISWPLGKSLLDNYGSSPDERRSDWPGDGVLERVDDAHIRGISVAAPASAIWPWLHQLGLDRGGFYSYELLERLAGWNLRNIERLLPGIEPYEIDQGVVLAPGDPMIWLASTEENRDLCFRTWRDDLHIAAQDPDKLGSWSFYLRPGGGNTTRLLIRTCNQHRRQVSLLSRALRRMLEEPLDLVMEVRMLRTLRRLAERRR
jgi:hypothetical protein